MAGGVKGLIKAEDVAAVKERTSLEDVIREHVTLRSAGPGSLKGLCPFHEEKTPSFTVRPAVGAWHCFGCGEGGDVFDFVRKLDHLVFTEAVERLAGKAGVELRYEDGAPRDRDDGVGRRTRLVEAHRVAAQRYAAWLVELPEARPARDFLRARGFDREAAERFGVGFAPRGGDALVSHLSEKGFRSDELTLAGLAAHGTRGPYDRFRGRLVWPIRDITGDTVGFGARRIFDDDRVEAKYLNTAETPIYKKSQLLYGLDLAKRSIAQHRQAVVVEGYTDVMACHLAGVPTAVATCGTAFGAEHVRLLRRILRDESDTAPARTIFTFDGDAAGQKAAMRAFAEDQRWASQSFVAVEAAGLDPCELRQQQGDDAVRALVDEAVPMFEFAVRTTVARFDLGTAEGRVQAMRAVAPIIAGIRDHALRPEYTRTVAGWLGVEVEQLAGEVSRAQRAGAAATRTRGAREPEGQSQERSGDLPSRVSPPGAQPAPDRLAAPMSGAAWDDVSPHAGPGDGAAMPHPDAVSLPRPDPGNPAHRAERQLLQLVLQFPGMVDADELAAVQPEAFTAPAHRAIFEAVVAAGGPVAAVTAAGWAGRVADLAAAAVRGMVSELAVAGVPARFDPGTGRPDQRYVEELLIRMREVTLARHIADAMSALRQAGAGDPGATREVSARLQGWQRELAQLKARLA